MASTSILSSRRTGMASCRLDRWWKVVEPTTVPRSPINRDLAYRDRAGLRKKARSDPSAFEALIPADIAERILVPNKLDEAHAILQSVADRRSTREWLSADPDEHVTLIDYRPPSLRLRVTPFPGVVATMTDGAIRLTLRDRDLDPPKKSRRVVH